MHLFRAAISDDYHYQLGPLTGLHNLFTCQSEGVAMISPEKEMKMHWRLC